MGCVATDDDHVCSHGGESFCRFYHLRNRARSFAEDAFGTVRDVSVIVYDCVDVLLVFDGFRCHDDFLHQIYGCHGAHAPHNADGFHSYLQSAAALAAQLTVYLYNYCMIKIIPHNSREMKKICEPKNLVQ